MTRHSYVTSPSFLRSFARRWSLGAPLLGTILTGASLGPVAPAQAASHAVAPAPTTPLLLKSVRVEGNKAVSTDDILRAFGYHPGEKVTQNDLKAAQDRVGQLYTQRNVGGSLGVQMRMTGTAILVTIKIAEQAAPASQAAQSLMLDSVKFNGNAAIPTNDLLAVTHLRAGQPVSDETVTADENAIQAAYAKKGVGVRIQPVATYPNHDNHVVLTWQISEKQ